MLAEMRFPSAPVTTAPVTAALIPEALPERRSRLTRPLPGRPVNRRELYLVGLPLTALALVCGWLGGHADAYDRLAVPVVAGLLLGVFLALLLTRWCLERVLAVLLGGMWVYLLGRIAFALFAVSGTSQLAALGVGALWIPVLLTLHIWMLGDRAGRQLSQLALGALLLLLVTAAVAQPALLGAPASVLLAQIPLAGLVGLIGQRSALQRLRQEVRQQRLGEGLTGHGDSLTGLPDDRRVRDWLRRAPPRRLTGLAVAVLRIDQPAAQLGGAHDPAFAGCLTAHVGRVLEGALRDQDVLGRVGDAEFVVLLRVRDERAARVACERLRLRVAARPLDGVNSSLSVGLAVYHAQSGGLALLDEARASLDGRCAASAGEAPAQLVRTPLESC